MSSKVVQDNPDEQQLRPPVLEWAFDIRVDFDRRLICGPVSGGGKMGRAGQQVPGFAWLKDDGTTMCGNWIYPGC